MELLEYFRGYFVDRSRAVVEQHASHGEVAALVVDFNIAAFMIAIRPRAAPD